MNKEYFETKTYLMTSRILGEKAKPYTFRNRLKIMYLTMIQKYYIRRSMKVERKTTL